MFNFNQKPAISHIHVVVQMFAHNKIHIHCIRLINSAPKNDIVIIQTSELDCINEEAMNQKSIHFHDLSVLVCNNFSNAHQVKFLNHVCKNLIQNKNIATHHAISLKSGLRIRIINNINKVKGNENLLNINI